MKMNEKTRADETVAALVERLARRAKEASRVLAVLPTEKKNALLRDAASFLQGECAEDILAANHQDVTAARKEGLSDAMVDRLFLDAKRLSGVARAIEEVAELPDPVGSLRDAVVRPNGLRVAQMRIPLGLIGMIYESRPNVTADAAALCIKSGNAVILRGGKEAFRSSQAIAAAFQRALVKHEVPEAAVTLLPTTDREATLALIRLSGVVDLVIPRGGEGLIRFVTESSRVPVVQHYKGVCHVYVDGEANLEKALQIVINSKTQRPGVCNAMETLLVDRACAERFVPRVVDALSSKGVEVRGDEAVRVLASAVRPATEEDWATEYLDLVASVRIVDGIEGAIAHIAQYGSQHTDAIVTENPSKAERFVNAVDSSAVMVNASTRFNDGGELGLGAEIGISTSKLHAFGPMGLRELCTFKWVVRGEGHVRS